MTENRLEAFERMLLDMQAQYAAATERLQGLKAQGRERRVTFRQLLGEKLSAQRMLTLYEAYGLIEPMGKAEGK